MKVKFLCGLINVMFRAGSHRVCIGEGKDRFLGICIVMEANVGVLSTQVNHNEWLAVLDHRVETQLLKRQKKEHMAWSKLREGYRLKEVIGPNMLYILALISIHIAFFSYIFTSLMSSMCVIAGIYLFSTLKTQCGTFWCKTSQKSRKRASVRGYCTGKHTSAILAHK